MTLTFTQVRKLPEGLGREVMIQYRLRAKNGSRTTSVEAIGVIQARVVVVFTRWHQQHESSQAEGMSFI